MTKWLFESWISHFIRCLRNEPGVYLDNRHLLVLDGHNSHVTLEVVRTAMEAGVDIIFLPSHTSHALEPLDVACFAPFKAAFRKLRDAWTLVNKNKKVGKCDLCQWTCKALQVALAAKSIKAGFRKIGIWSVNREAATKAMKPSAGFEEEDGEGGNRTNLHTNPSTRGDLRVPGQGGRDPDGIAQHVGATA